jgi:uncharacterized protein
MIQFDTTWTRMFTRRGTIRVFWIMILLLLLTVFCANARAYEAVIEQNVGAAMRDGVALRADVYRPKAEGRFPVILQRTPYNKAQGLEFGMRSAEAGYVAVIQDVRGRFASGGEWYPFRHEAADGYDSVEWAAALPYSNGKVCLYGGSYVGVTVMLAASAHPPHLAAIFAVATGDNYYEGWTYRGGALQQWFVQTWASILARHTLERRTRENERFRDWANELPVSAYPMLPGVDPKSLAPYYVDWLRHPSYDSYWKQWALDYSVIGVPGCHVGGWYDTFQSGTLANYQGLRKSASTEAARRAQRLIMGPWLHGSLLTSRTGELDFGSAARFEMGGQARAWFDSVLNNSAAGKPVRLFVMGENVWRDEQEWPLARARETRYFLHSLGKANTLAGDGTLSPEAPREETPDRFTYDPGDPVPTQGGPICCTGRPAGVQDQRSVEARHDVLVYTTPAFGQDFEVTGPIAVDLYAASSAVDTDFTAKLVDVWPNGFAQNLTEGLLRARYRNSREKPEFLRPGAPARLRVEIGATSNVFRAGHRLRLEISSSNFPEFDRNLNTGEDNAFATKAVKAANTIFHDTRRPSALILPVVPR